MNFNDSADQGKSKTKSISSSTIPDVAKVEENVEVSAIESPPVRFLQLFVMFLYVSIWR